MKKIVKLSLSLTLMVTAFLASGCTASSTPPARNDIPNKSRPSGSAYAGEWVGHGRELKINAAGAITATAMTYRTCGKDFPPCDTDSGASLKPGAIANGKITSSLNGKIRALIISTTDPDIFPVGHLTIVYEKRSDSMMMSGMLFCGPRAQAGYCGA